MILYAGTAVNDLHELDRVRAFWRGPSQSPLILVIPLDGEFLWLPSRRRSKVPCCKINKYKKSFIAAAMGLSLWRFNYVCTAGRETNCPLLGIIKIPWPWINSTVAHTETTLCVNVFLVFFFRCFIRAVLGAQIWSFVKSGPLVINQHCYICVLSWTNDAIAPLLPQPACNHSINNIGELWYLCWCCRSYWSYIAHVFCIFSAYMRWINFDMNPRAQE